MGLFKGEMLDCESPDRPAQDALGVFLYLNALARRRRARHPHAWADCCGLSPWRWP